MKNKAETLESRQALPMSKHQKQSAKHFTWEMSAKEALKVNYLTRACSTRDQGQIKL